MPGGSAEKPPKEGDREFTKPLPVPNDTNSTSDLRSVLEKTAETPTGADPKMKTQKRDG